MKFIILFLPFFFAFSKSENVGDKVYSALAEISFYDKLKESPQFSSCANEQQYDLASQKIDTKKLDAIAKCVEDKLDIEANAEALDEIFKNDEGYKASPSKDKKDYIQKNLRKKFYNTLLGEQTFSGNTEQKIASTIISPLDIQNIYNRQLQKNRAMLLSQYCLTREHSQDKSVEEQIIATFDKIKTQGYEELKDFFNKCNQDLNSKSCDQVGSSSSGNKKACIMRDKLRKYDSVLKQVAKNKSGLKNIAQGDDSFFNQLKILKELGEDDIEKLTSISSDELIEAQTDGEGDDFYEEQANQIKEHCKKNKISNPKCEELIHKSELERFNKLKVKISVNQDRKIHKIEKVAKEDGKDALITYLKDEGEFTDKEIEKLEGKGISELQEVLRKIYEGRKKSLLSQLDEQIEKRLFTDQENISAVSNIENSTRSKGEVLKSLVAFSNTLSIFTLDETSTIDYEIKQSSSDNVPWIKKIRDSYQTTPATDEKKTDPSENWEGF